MTRERIQSSCERDLKWRRSVSRERGRRRRLALRAEHATEHGAWPGAATIGRRIDFERGAALGAAHLQAARRNAALVDLIRGLAARALDFEHTGELLSALPESYESLTGSPCFRGREGPLLEPQALSRNVFKRRVTDHGSSV